MKDSSCVKPVVVRGQYKSREDDCYTGASNDISQKKPLGVDWRILYKQARQVEMRRSRLAFTIIEVLVVIGITGVLMAILLPVMEKVRHRGYIDVCASNLRQMGQAMAIYAGENHGSYPRGAYVQGALPTAGTGIASTDPFGPAGPGPNDVSAAIWLLVRAQKLPLSLCICPYNDVNEFEVDKAVAFDQSNFTNVTKNLGYSYANPYPDAAAANAGYKLNSKTGSTFAVMADLNPGVSKIRKADVFTPDPSSPQSQLSSANSENHEREGQNVLYGDGHVSYVSTPFCGMNGDNIYTGKSAVRPSLFVSPAGPTDSVLLPVD